MCRAASLILLALGLCLPLASCGGDRDGTFDEVRTLQRSPGRVPAGLTEGDRLFGSRAMGGHGADPHAGPAAGTPSFAWTTPEEWEEVQGGSMRAASWRVKGQPQTDCSLSMLPRGAGDLLANVNRWCQQMGAAELDAAALESLPRIPMLAHQAVLVNIAGSYAGMGGGAKIDDARLLGAILELPGVDIFLKLTGPAAVVEAQQANFAALAASVTIRAHGGGDTAAPPPPASTSKRPSSFSWTVPEGWEERPARSMRLVTVAPKGATDTECYLTVLGGDGGGLEANINRWEGQMGQAALTSEQIATLERVEVLGSQAVLVRIRGTFRGMGDKALDDATMFGMVCEREGHVLFAKMYGPSSTMPAQWDNFVAFCRSVKQ